MFSIIMTWKSHDQWMWRTITNICALATCNLTSWETNTSFFVSAIAIIGKFNDSFYFLAPEEDIRRPFQEYFDLGCSDVQITDLLKSHYDNETYGLRYVNNLLSKTHWHQTVIPVLSRYEDYEKNGISCQLVNKNTPWIQSTNKYE